jgi:hypothetical protein
MATNLDDVFKKPDNPLESNIRQLESEVLERITNQLRDNKIEMGVAPGSLSATDAGQYFGRKVPSAISLIDKIQNSFQPDSLEDSLSHSYAWYDKDDLLGDLIDIKTDFIVNGMNFFVYKDESDHILDLLSKLDDESTDESKKEYLKTVSELAELKEKFERIALQFEIKDVFKSLARDFIITNNFILYWRTTFGGGDSQEVDADVNLSQFGSETSGLIDINALKVTDIQWDNTLGKDELSSRIPQELAARIEIALGQEDGSMRTKMIESLLREGVPEKYIKAVDDGDEFVLLDKDDGDNWKVFTTERKHYGLAKPAMSKIFVPLATRLMNTEGEFGASVMMKHFIFHIKCGESIESGPNAGSTKNWATPEEVEYYADQFKGVNKTKVIATNHTVEFSFIHPPIELFSPEKFKNSDNRILNFIGISNSILSGEGGNYGSGYVAIKRLISNVIEIRRMLTDAFNTMASSEDFRNAIDLPEGYSVGIGFSELTLKEQRQVLDEIKALLSDEIMPPDMALTELGRNPHQAREGKIKAMIENLVLELWEKRNNGEQTSDNNEEGNQGDTDSSPGRPANEDTVVNEETRNQDPGGRLD